MKSRKFQIAITAMGLIFVGLILCHFLTALPPLYGAFVTGICSVAGLYKVANVTDSWASSKGLDTTHVEDQPLEKDLPGPQHN